MIDILLALNVLATSAIAVAALKLLEVHHEELPQWARALMLGIVLAGGFATLEFLGAPGKCQIGETALLVLMGTLAAIRAFRPDLVHFSLPSPAALRRDRPRLAGAINSATASAAQQKRGELA
jgi:hypothetical protein